MKAFENINKWFDVADENTFKLFILNLFRFELSLYLLE